MTTEAEDERSEQDYDRGHRAAWSGILQQAMAALGMSGRTLESLVLEREWTVAALRSVCAEHGDNEWEPTLSLADVVEKHLARHLGQ